MDRPRTRWSGIASFGGTAAFVGRVNDDQLGAVFGHDLRAAGVEYLTPPADGGEPTGRCLIVVTPDAERTLNTYPRCVGQARARRPRRRARGERAQVLYLEGYLWDEPEAKDAFRRAARLAHDAGNRVAFTLSDAFCVDRHRDEFLELIEHEVDVLFANEAEITSLYQVDEFDDALQRVHAPLRDRGAHPEREGRGDRDARRGARGRRAPGHRASSTPPAPATSTPPGSSTGSRTATTSAPPGGWVRSRPSEVISHLGPRPQVSLAELARPLLEPTLAMKLPRYRTGNEEIDRKVAELVDEVADPANADLVFEIVASALRLAVDGADRGDLKIASAALKEMRHAFYVFAPYRAARKVAIFGSARTQPDDPLYVQTREFAAAVADRDWMVVTGAGPGIMEAGIEGAGPDQAFGVSIKLPFEAATTQFFDGDPKLINFRYFFTRKLEFVKESDAFVLLPGGFGTLDEAFELLTLLQTGKAQPAPVILLDVPGGTYWQTWQAFVTVELVNTGYISGDDHALTCTTDDIQVAVDEIMRFYANYDSLRFVGGRLVLRMQRAPSPEELGGAERGLRRHRRAWGDRDARGVACRDRRRRPRRPGADRVLVRPAELGAPPDDDRPPQRHPRFLSRAATLTPVR